MLRQFVHQRLGNHVAHSPLNVSDGHLHRERVDHVGGRLVAQQEVADLRCVAVSDDELMPGLDQSGECPGRDTRVGELLIDVPFLIRQGNRVTAKCHDNQ